jgi:hypothetical protein
MNIIIVMMNMENVPSPSSSFIFNLFQAPRHPWVILSLNNIVIYLLMHEHGYVRTNELMNHSIRS